MGLKDGKTFLPSLVLWVLASKYGIKSYLVRDVILRRYNVLASKYGIKRSFPGESTNHL